MPLRALMATLAKLALVPEVTGVCESFIHRCDADGVGGVAGAADTPAPVDSPPASPPPADGKALFRDKPAKFKFATLSTALEADR